MAEIQCHESIRSSHLSGVPLGKVNAGSFVNRSSNGGGPFRTGGPFNDEILPADQPGIFIPGVGQKIPLPPAAPSYLTSLTEAYEAIFNVMSSTVIAQVNGQNSLQQLDLTMNQIVTASINIAVTQEQNLNQKIMYYQKEEQHSMQTAEKWGKIFQYLGIALFIGTILLAIPTGGGDAPLLSEELELNDLTGGESSSGSTGAQMSTFNSSSTALTDISSSSDVISETTEEDDVPDYMKSTQKMMSQDTKMPELKVPEEDDASSEESEDSKAPDYMKDTQNMMKGANNNLTEFDQTEEEMANSSAKSSESLGNSASNMQKYALRLAKTFVGAGAGAMNAIPLILKGRSSLFQSHYMNIISNLTRALGTPMGLMQENSAYFQFYQQLVQRGTGNIQELAEEASQVVELDGSVMGLYRQTAVNLAQSA